MADKQYDVSPKLLRLFQEKTKIREAIRLKVLASENSPYRNPVELVDPAIVRYHSMLTYRPEYMYATPKNTSLFCCFILLPIVVTYFGIKYSYDKREKIYRSGKVAYKDRQFLQVL